MLIKLLPAGFTLAHAGIHASFISPRPPARDGAPAWPFDLERSWLLTPMGLGSRAARGLGTALLALTLAGFALAALALLGLLPIRLWVPATALGSIASLSLLVVFFHRWLVLGVIIDLGLLWAVLVHGWTP